MKKTNEIIKDLREDKDLSQKHIANLLDIAQQTYSSYETGLYDLPIRHLSILATLFNVSTDFLLGRTDYSGSIGFLNITYIDNVTVGKMLNDLNVLDNKSKQELLKFAEFLKYKKEK